MPESNKISTLTTLKLIVNTYNNRKCLVDKIQLYNFPQNQRTLQIKILLNRITGAKFTTSESFIPEFLFTISVSRWFFV